MPAQYVKAVVKTDFIDAEDSEQLQLVVHLSVEGGRLTVKLPNNPAIPLDAASHDEFFPATLETSSSIQTPALVSQRSSCPRKPRAGSSLRK